MTIVSELVPTRYSAGSKRGARRPFDAHELPASCSPGSAPGPGDSPLGVRGRPELGIRYTRKTEGRGSTRVCCDCEDGLTKPICHRVRTCRVRSGREVEVQMTGMAGIPACSCAAASRPPGRSGATGSPMTSSSFRSLAIVPRSVKIPLPAVKLAVRSDCPARTQYGDGLGPQHR